METPLILESGHLHETNESDWLGLSHRIRERLAALETTSPRPPDARELNILTSDVRELCDRFDNLRSEVHELLDQHYGSTSRDESASPHVEAAKEQEFVAIQREQYKKSHDPLEVLKALFLWRDNPEDRRRSN